MHIWPKQIFSMDQLLFIENSQLFSKLKNIQYAVFSQVSYEPFARILEEIYHIIMALHSIWGIQLYYW